MVLHTLDAFLACARITHIVLVLAPDDQGLAVGDARVVPARVGGASRAESVLNGLEVLARHGAHDEDWVLVHDAARCLVTPALIDALVDACRDDEVGGLLALPLPDTLKVAGQEGRVVATVRRDDKWLAQTPQMFRFGLLRDVLRPHAASGFAGITDEASAVELAGHAPRLVRGSAANFKVTYPEDFALAEAILRSRQ
jgi:2-C-methyl-D-erythritol 4-phosphate cytidylyltransferase